MVTLFIMFTNIKAISKILHQGTFSYKKFKTETKLCGQVLKYEYQYEYIAQLPYFKIITYKLRTLEKLAQDPTKTPVDAL